MTKLEEATAYTQKLNRLNIQLDNMVSGRFPLEFTPEVHYNSAYACSNVSGFPAYALEKLIPFVIDARGTIGIHPVKGNDTLVIRF